MRQSAARPPGDPRPPAPAGRHHGWLGRQIDTLYPGSFALVMATGIISNAFYFEGMHGISEVLFDINVAAYAWLIAATAARLVRAPRALWADLTSPQLTFAFFTLVAATDVLGFGILVRGHEGLALSMWAAALGLWVVLIYLSFGVLIFLNTAHGANVVHGGWLIAIVGTQSLVVLGTQVAPAAGSAAPTIFVLIHMLWGVGLALYGIFIVLFAQRVFFIDVAPDDITPLLWVVMGAAAITTNAGAMLILTDSRLPYLHAMRPFIDGVTLIAWAWATFWIPLLVLFGLWKHGACRVPLRYTPMLWSLVFPLGMFALASLRLSLAAGVPLLRVLSQGMVWIALAAWIATAMGLAWSVAQSLRASARVTS